LFTHSTPVKTCFISLSESVASFSSIIDRAWPSSFVLTLPYPKGLSKTVVSIAAPLDEAFIRLFYVSSFMRGTSP
jgi:hypothetical protein